VRLVGEATGRAVRLGDPVSVQVGRIEHLRGRVELVPAGTETYRPPRRERRRR
jgi:hypothetical protein